MVHLRREVTFLRQRLNRWEADDGTPVPLAAVLAAEQRAHAVKERAVSAGVRCSAGVRRSSASSGELCN